MIALMTILILVLLLPFTSEVVEKNLELFLFVMGMIAVIVSEVLTTQLLLKALKEPLVITAAVVIAGFLFGWFQKSIAQGITSVGKMLHFRLFLALIVIILGLVSSVITAIIAAVLLVNIVSLLNLDRKAEIRLVVLACYSIGLGAVLTPIGEPLSTIATSKLQVDFFYLFRLIGLNVILGVLVFGILAALMINPKRQKQNNFSTKEVETSYTIIIRGIKIYLFIMALTLLGAGFEPFINRYILYLNPKLLFWINMTSAVLDNATLAAAEISPEMNEPTIKAILLGLLVSGGMLIPGNIPNIIVADKLTITSSEWARFAVPIGLCAMVAYYIVISFNGFN